MSPLRGETIDPLTVGVCHLSCRCVRSTWLCGKDPVTGKDYEHRRQWVSDRLALQASLFAIEIAFDAVMVNHTHNVSVNRPDVVATWSDEEVVRRNLMINQLPRCFNGNLRKPSAVEIRIEITLSDEQRMQDYRIRLSDPSWFMKQLNEYLARRINKEDGVTGRVWEGPFKCRRLEDESALLVCGIYVDLNQVRSGEVKTPEESTYTSAYLRIEGAKFLAEHADYINQNDDRIYRERPDGWLAELTLEEGPNVDARNSVLPSKFPRLTDKGLLPMRLKDYLELLDWTGRNQVSEKRAAIPDHLASILERLHVNAENWFETIDNFDTLFGRAVGRTATMINRAKASGRGWIRGARNCANAFT
jgi:hypothetical protein